jgi:hypothetical protein
LFFAVSSGGVVIHVAGVAPPVFGTVGEGGPATEAALNNAEDVAVAPNGDIYVADYNSARLLRISDGILTVAYRGDAALGENDFGGVTVADDGAVYFTTGAGVTALAADGDVEQILVAGAESAQVYSQKVAVDPEGRVVLAGGILPRIDLIGPDGQLTPLAGADELATEAGVGDGGPAVEARFGRISDIAIDSTGVVYVSDDGFGDVRRIGTDGIISTVFGAGTIPVLDAVDGTPATDVDYGSAEIGVAVDDQDRLYVVTRLGGTVVRIDDGAVTRVAGGGTNQGVGFAPLETQLQAPFRIALTRAYDLLILVEDGRYLYQAATEPAASLVASVPSPGDINFDPVVVAASLALTAGMLFLFPFPAEIFNTTLAEHHDEILGWFRRGSRPQSRFWEGRWVLAVGFVVMALLYGFLDPGFGASADSVSVFAGLLIGVVITTFGFLVPVLAVRRSRTGTWGKLRVLPVAIIVGIGCVVLSRAIAFVPGYLYGIALGVVFAGAIGEDVEAAEVTAGSVFVLALAIASWFGLGMVRSGGDWPLAGVIEAALAMTTVAAFEAVVFGLIPIQGMPGKVLFRSRRLLWAVIWGVSVLAFFHVLVNPHSGYLVNTAMVPVATTYGLMALFGVVSVALWAWFRRRGEPDRVDPPRGADQAGE